MAKYIDADAALKRFEEMHGNESELLNCYNADWIISFIETQPTADVEEVRHAKWIYEDYHDMMGHAFQCSVCGRWMFANSTEHVPEEYPYCHCGAKMEGVEGFKEEDE